MVVFRRSLVAVLTLSLACTLLASPPYYTWDIFNQEWAPSQSADGDFYFEFDRTEFGAANMSGTHTTNNCVQIDWSADMTDHSFDLASPQYLHITVQAPDGTQVPCAEVLYIDSSGSYVIEVKDFSGNVGTSILHLTFGADYIAGRIAIYQGNVLYEDLEGGSFYDFCPMFTDYYDSVRII